MYINNYDSWQGFGQAQQSLKLLDEPRSFRLFLLIDLQQFFLSPGFTPFYPPNRAKKRFTSKSARQHLAFLLCSIFQTLSGKSFDETKRPSSVHTLCAEAWEKSCIRPIKSTFKFISANILSFFSPCFKVKILSFIALCRKVLPRLSQKSCMDTTMQKLSCSSQKFSVFLRWTLCYNDARNTEKQKGGC